ncbi:MAG: DUF3144 domain-containing protein [Rhodospirillales bacterium]
MAEDVAAKGAEDAENAKGVDIANRFINAANDCLQEGHPPEAVAQAMRHAAGNFSAFAASHTDAPDAAAAAFAQEFKDATDYYLPLHLKNRKPVTGLEQLIDTVKKEQPKA